jgi:glycerol-3-phosphate dehydrogenase (NAD(P)+)
MAQAAAIIGDGAMGTLCAILLTQNGRRVRMWSAFEEHARDIRRQRENKRFLPGFPLPERLAVSTDAAQVCDGAEVVVIAVPTRHLRGVLERVREALPAEALYVSVVKGIERETLLRPSEVLQVVVGEKLTRHGGRVVVLSGPCLSREVAAGLPATVVVASQNAKDAETAREAFSTPYFRVYTNDDPVGVELGGALKNITAIAAGICDGLELGSNAKAALVTRGLVEMTRLGVALGARAETFAGLAGLGDLVTTCISDLSRNHHVGLEIGRGRRLADVLADMGRIEAEGVETTRSVVALAAKSGVEMPITQEVYAVLFEGKPAPDALADLMSRRPKAERPAATATAEPAPSET